MFDAALARVIVAVAAAPFMPAAAGALQDPDGVEVEAVARRAAKQVQVLVPGREPIGDRLRDRVRLVPGDVVATIQPSFSWTCPITSPPPDPYDPAWLLTCVDPCDIADGCELDIDAKEADDAVRVTGWQLPRLWDWFASNGLSPARVLEYFLTGAGLIADNTLVTV